MKVTEIPYKIKLARDPRRSGGLHQSSIIRGIALQMGYLDSKYADEEFTDDLLMAIGLAFEDYIFKFHHPNVLYHPPEMEVDGIKLSLDGIEEDDGDLYTKIWGEVAPRGYSYCQVVEAKTTHKSSRGLEVPSVGFQDKKFWMWLCQIKGYCKALGTLDAILHALFMCGSYGKTFEERKPQYRIFAFRFSESEIDENWAMINNNRHLGKEE